MFDFSGSFLTPLLKSNIIYVRFLELFCWMIFLADFFDNLFYNFLPQFYILVLEIAYFISVHILSIFYLDFYIPFLFGLSFLIFVFSLNFQKKNSIFLFTFWISSFF